MTVKSRCIDFITLNCWLYLFYFVLQIVAVLSYRFKMQMHKHSVFLVMKPRETIMFYWQTFLLWTGIHSAHVDEEPDNVLPPVSINIF
jgi:hypothetical protein